METKMSFFIRQVRVVVPGKDVRKTCVRFADGMVAAVGTELRPDAGDQVIEGGGRLLTPGLVDIHLHGIEHHCFDTPFVDWQSASVALAKFGVTTALPTMLPRNQEGMLKSLESAASAIDNLNGTRFPGLHLEGPFVGVPGAGCVPTPGDLGLLEEILAACGGKVRAMSLGPEVENVIPVIERLLAGGVAPFVTHTRAGLHETLAAIDAGARHATHFYDVFPAPPENRGVRPAGVVEPFLLDPRCTVDFIADGCHVDPRLITLVAKNKGCDRVGLVTDANIGSGLPPGEYDSPWGYKVRVRRGDGVRVADPEHPKYGALAGSALTMNEGMANLLNWLDDVAPEQVWAMGTTVPARAAGLERAGILDEGFPADAVLWNDDLTPAYTWVDGEVVFQG